MLEKEFTERETEENIAENNFINWINKKQINFEIKKFETNDKKYKIYRCFLSKNKVLLAVGNGKGVKKQALLGSMYESLEHYYFLNQRHKKRKKLIKNIILQNDKFQEDNPLVYIFTNNPSLELNVDEFYGLKDNSSIYYPSFLNDTSFNQLDLKKTSEAYSYSSDSGFAIGVTRTEATIHALNELIERDSVSRTLLKYGLNMNNQYVNATIVEELPQNLEVLKKSIEETINGHISLIKIVNLYNIPVFLAVSKKIKCINIRFMDPGRP